MTGMSMLAELAVLLPEVALLAGAVAGLLVGLFLPRRRQWLVAVTAAVTLLAVAVLSLVGAPTAPRSVFEDTYTVDTAITAARVIVAGATLLVIALSAGWARGRARETEFYILLLFAALGTILLAGASDLTVLMVAYLVASIPGYALAGFAKDSSGVEAALKYYLMGALFGIITLAGITVLYGIGRATAYTELAATLPDAPSAAVAVGVVGVLAGLAFKTGAVPGQFWVPDVIQGAPVPVAAFVTTVPKVGGLVAAYRLVDTALGDTTLAWPLLVAILAAASMTLGNLAAFFQDDSRRLLAYSTISQVGYALLAVAAAGRSNLALMTLLFYLAGYAVTNLGAFAVVAARPRARRLADYTALFSADRWLAVSLVVCLLGLVGTPPAAVFLGKVGVFTAATDAGLAWLMVVAAINTVASIFYYLRWIVPLFQTGAAPAAATDPWARGVAFTAAAFSLVLGVGAGVVLPTLV